MTGQSISIIFILFCPQCPARLLLIPLYRHSTGPQLDFSHHYNFRLGQNASRHRQQSPWCHFALGQRFRSQFVCRRSYHNARMADNFSPSLSISVGLKRSLSSISGGDMDHIARTRWQYAGNGLIMPRKWLLRFDKQAKIRRARIQGVCCGICAGTVYVSLTVLSCNSFVLK